MIKKVTFSRQENDKYPVEKRIGLGILTGAFIGSFCGMEFGPRIGFKEQFVFKHPSDSKFIKQPLDQCIK